MAIIDVLSQAEQLFKSVSFYLDKLFIALVIILVGFIIGKIVESVLRYLFVQISLDDRLTKAFKAKRNYARAIRRTIVRIIYIATVLIALDKLSLVDPVFTLVTFLAVVVILISLVLAGMDVVPNIVARASLRRKRIAVGDEVIVNDKAGQIQGTIVDITMTDVHVKRRNGDLLFIPISVFLKENVMRRRRMS
jgi:small-conductance mechanosensitive channel